MQKVNLSRLNNIIKTVRERINKTRMKAMRIQNQKSFMVFSETTDEDITKFANVCKEECEEFNALAEEMILDTHYLNALRALLDKANRKYGVLDLLREISAVQSYKDTQTFLGNFMSQSINPNYFSVNEIRSAGFYKGAFTDDKRVYTLSVNVFDNEDVKHANELVEAADAKIHELQDELARINQSKFIEIPDRDEWKKDAGNLAFFKPSLSKSNKTRKG